MIKQVIVVRTHYLNSKGQLLRPSMGKLISQACHASMGALLKDRTFGYTWEGFGHLQFYSEFQTEGMDKYGEGSPALLVYLSKAMGDWLKGSFVKIVLGCSSEEELLALRDKVEEAQILHCLITDNGTTVFGGVPAITCLAIGPEESEKIDAITGHLKLL